jgi:hypothetical protein
LVAEVKATPAVTEKKPAPAAAAKKPDSKKQSLDDAFAELMDE